MRRIQHFNLGLRRCLYILGVLYSICRGAIEKYMPLNFDYIPTMEGIYTPLLFQPSGLNDTSFLKTNVRKIIMLRYLLALAGLSSLAAAHGLIDSMTIDGT